MTLEGLEQALDVAKWGDAEEDAIQVISRVLELPEAAVERVLFAWRVARESHRNFPALSESCDEGPRLPYELRRAISDAVTTGMKRARVRYAIQNDWKLHVRPSKLVRDNIKDICNGCPISIECAVTSASKPETCVKRGVLREIRREGDSYASLRGHTPVTPVKIRDNQVTVTCDHPRGTWTLNIEDFEP